MANLKVPASSKTSLKGISPNDYLANVSRSEVNPRNIQNSILARFPPNKYISPYHPALDINFSDRVYAFKSELIATNWDYWRNTLHFYRELDQARRAQWTYDNFKKLEKDLTESNIAKELESRHFYFQAALRKALDQMRLMNLSSLIRYKHERSNLEFRFNLRDAEIQESLEKGRIVVDNILNTKAEESLQLIEQLSKQSIRNRRDWELINAIAGQQNLQFFQLANHYQEQNNLREDSHQRKLSLAASVSGSTTKKVS